MRYVRTFEGYKNYKSNPDTERKSFEKYSMLLEGVELSSDDNELFMNLNSCSLFLLCQATTISDEVINHLVESVTRIFFLIVSFGHLVKYYSNWVQKEQISLLFSLLPKLFSWCLSSQNKTDTLLVESSLCLNSKNIIIAILCILCSKSLRKF